MAHRDVTAIKPAEHRYAPGRRAVLLLAVCLVVSGCARPTGQLSGKVTWQQQPVANAEIVVTSAENPADQFSGLSGPDGVYQISYRTEEGLPPGKYQVRIARYTLPGGKPLPAGEEGDVLKNSNEAVRSTVDFQQEIVAGPNHIDFELTDGVKVGQQ